MNLRFMNLNNYCESVNEWMKTIVVDDDLFRLKFTDSDGSYWECEPFHHWDPQERLFVATCYVDGYTCDRMLVSIDRYDFGNNRNYDMFNKMFTEWWASNR